MSRDSLGRYIDRLRNKIYNESMADVPDGDLLDRYLAEHNKAALETLIARHAPMVMAVCRRVAITAQDAEDAFQATFVVLMHKAATIRPSCNVGCWLHGVATRVALRTRTSSARKFTRERPLGDRAIASPCVKSEWDDLLPILDRELASLPETYRTVVVLCDLEGKTRVQVAQLLGCPEGTVAGRLARARALLAERMARHRLPVAGSVLAALLAPGTTSASVPGPLLDGITAALETIAMGRAVTMPPKVTALVDFAIKAMVVSKFKSLIGVMIVGMILFSGAAPYMLLRGVPTAVSQVESPQNPVIREQPQEPTPSPAGNWWFECNGFDGVLSIKVGADGEITGSIHNHLIQGQWDKMSHEYFFVRLVDEPNEGETAVQRYSGKRVYNNERKCWDLAGGMVSIAGPRWGEDNLEYRWKASPYRNQLPAVSTNMLMFATYQKLVASGQVAHMDQQYFRDLTREMLERSRQWLLGWLRPFVITP